MERQIPQDTHHHHHHDTRLRSVSDLVLKNIMQKKHSKIPTYLVPRRGESGSRRGKKSTDSSRELHGGCIKRVLYIDGVVNKEGVRTMRKSTRISKLKRQVAQDRQEVDFRDTSVCFRPKAGKKFKNRAFRATRILSFLLVPSSVAFASIPSFVGPPPLSAACSSFPLRRKSSNQKAMMDLFH